MTGLAAPGLPSGAARAALAAVLLCLAVLVAGCRIQVGYPHACDGHGGTRALLKGIYYCHDGSTIGAGWLWLHPGDPRARP